MTIREVERQFRYWRSSPPEHEMMAMFARVFTTWEPAESRPMTEAEHRASLEARWKSGAAMNVKQVFEATGGTLSLSGAGGPARKAAKPPGIGPFPGM